jgi:hypothetical protein
LFNIKIKRGLILLTYNKCTERWLLLNNPEILYQTGHGRSVSEIWQHMYWLSYLRTCHRYCTELCCFIRDGDPVCFTCDIKQLSDSARSTDITNRAVFMASAIARPHSCGAIKEHSLLANGQQEEWVWLLIEAAVTRIFLKLSRVPEISGVTGLSCANLSKFCKTFVDIKKLLCWNAVRVINDRCPATQSDWCRYPTLLTGLQTVSTERWEQLWGFRLGMCDQLLCDWD